MGFNAAFNSISLSSRRVSLVGEESPKVSDLYCFRKTHGQGLSTVTNLSLQLTIIAFWNSQGTQLYEAKSDNWITPCTCCFHQAAQMLHSYTGRGSHMNNTTQIVMLKTLKLSTWCTLTMPHFHFLSRAKFCLTGYVLMDRPTLYFLFLCHVKVSCSMCSKNSRR